MDISATVEAPRQGVDFLTNVTTLSASTTIQPMKLKGAANAQQWLQSVNLKCYWFATPGRIASGPHAGAEREFLDIKSFRPTTASTSRILLAVQDPMPVSCYRLTTSGLESFIFFTSTFNQLWQLHCALRPDSRHLCAVVLNNAPCHQYFDLDYSLKKDRNNIVVPQTVADYARIKDRTDEIIAEWYAYWSLFFMQEVGMRAIDLSVVQIETANCEGKFSIHIHVVSEAFVDVNHHKAAVVRFVEWLKHKAPMSLLLLVLDVSVYTQQRNLRLVGSCKPGKQTLALYDYPNRRVLPLDAINSKHLFNGLVSQALVVSSDYKPISCSDDAFMQPNRRAKRSNPPAHDSCHGKKQRAGVPSPRRDEIVQAVQQYGFEIQGDMNTDGFFECVQPAAGRVCFFTGDDGTPIRHSRNRAKCWLNECGVWLGCHSGKCGGKKMLLLAPPESGGQDGDEEKSQAQDDDRGQIDDGEATGSNAASDEEGDLEEVGGQGDGQDEEKKQQPDVGRPLQEDVPEAPLLRDDRPELSAMETIHTEWATCHQAALKKSKKQASSSQPSTAQKGKAAYAKLYDIICLNLVTYLNKYLMAIVRGGKAVIISEIVAMNKTTKRFAYQHAIWSVNEFNQIHINWRLRGISDPITTIWLLHSKRRQVDDIVFRPQPHDFVDSSVFKHFNLYKRPGITRTEAAAWARNHPDWRQQAEPMIDHIYNIWC